MPNNFREFFQIKEAASVSAQARSELPAEYVRTARREVRTALANVGGLNARFIDILASYFSWLYGMEGVGGVASQFQKDWDALGAYLTQYANDAALRSRLTSTTYTRSQITADAQRYHRDLAFKGRNYDKGPDGLEIVDVPREVYKLFSHHPDIILGLPKGDQAHWAFDNWEGWAWKSLGCGYSKGEGAAGGHCGNSSRKSGDNLLSLRDPEDRVHLTFVVNAGVLGEMKAAGNTKPGSIYHPAICTLLASPYVVGIAGGGYMPEVNFDLADLATEELRDLMTKLMGDREPVTPENVRPVEYIGTFSQEDVDAADVPTKKDILRDVTNVLADLGHDGPIEQAVGLLRFDLPGLVRSVLPALKLREVDELWERLADIESRVDNENTRRKNKATGEPIPPPVSEELLIEVAEYGVSLAGDTPRLVKFLEMVGNHSYGRPAVKDWVRDALADLAEVASRQLSPAQKHLWKYIHLLFDVAEEDHYSGDYRKMYDMRTVGLAEELASQHLVDGLKARKAMDEDASDSLDEVWQSYLWATLYRRHDVSYHMKWDDHGTVYLTWDVRSVIENEMAKALADPFRHIVTTSTHLFNKRMLYGWKGKYLIKAGLMKLKPQVTKAVANRVQALLGLEVCREYDDERSKPDLGRFRRPYDGTALVQTLNTRPAEVVDEFVRIRHSIDDVIKDVVARHVKHAGRWFRDNLDVIAGKADEMAARGERIYTTVSRAAGLDRL